MRKTLEFRRDLAELRSQWGENEYHRDEILPEVVALMSEHGIRADALMRDAASHALNEAEKEEDRRQLDQPNLFPFDAQIALGEGRRIKRGRMTLEQHRRRGRIIDANKAAQDRAWAAENEWLHDGEDALWGYSLMTVREDVLNEDGSRRPDDVPPPSPEPISPSL